MSYNPDGTLNGFSAEAAAGVSLRLYDGLGRPTHINHNLPGTSRDTTWNLAYNPASQLISQTRSNDAYAWTGAYNVERPYAANGLNQYTAAGPATFAYDANGNLTTDGGDSYVYDIENRLVRVTGGHPASSSTSQAGMARARAIGGGVGAG